MAGLDSLDSHGCTLTHTTNCDSLYATFQLLLRTRAKPSVALPDIISAGSIPYLYQILNVVK